ncbi:MAG: hypothetical protein K1X79_01520 [Oligoflexia bacterium]|nr:hypothetical protein [Oligoflexia bacterium]
MESDGRLAAFREHISREARWFSEQHFQNILLLHHNDCDGLSSGALLLTLFERLGCRVRRYSLEKPFPLALARIFSDFASEAQGLCVFSDFGSGMLSSIQRLIAGRFPVMLLDHHTLENSSLSGIHLINPIMHGLRGLPDCSASTIAALFALEFGESFRDLSPLGILGALGDRAIDARGELLGVNRIVLEYACASKLVTSCAPYHFSGLSNREGHELASWVDALGGFGYFRGGPDIAIKGLRESFDEPFQTYANNFQQEFLTLSQSYLEEGVVKRGKRIDYFHLGPEFDRYGVKTVGLMCDFLIKRSMVSADKYLAGFQNVPNEIPGLGALELNQVKVSMRLGARLCERVLAGECPALNEILPNATNALGGFVDACHEQAAATTIPLRMEQKLLELLEEQLERAMCVC